MKPEADIHRSVIDAGPVGAVSFAEHIGDTTFTANREIDEHLRNLEAHKLEWAKLEISDRLQLLEQARKDFWAVKDQWIQSELDAKGLAPGTFGEAEEWILLAQLFRAIRQIQTAMKNTQPFGRSIGF